MTRGSRAYAVEFEVRAVYIVSRAELGRANRIMMCARASARRGANQT
jgi:hypothetical protein